MRGDQRRVYVELANELNTSLCSFCNFAEGGGCDEGCDCGHPLSDHLNEEMEPGCDCWAFRSWMKVWEAADFVGFMLVNSDMESGWSWNRNKDGVLCFDYFPKRELAHKE